MVSQFRCFPPTNFTPRQALYVESFCWVAAGWQSTENGFPLLLHKYFPYTLLLLAVVVYIPALFWRITTAPQLSSNLSFIMEELEHCYNQAILLAFDNLVAKDITEDFRSRRVCDSNLEVEKGTFKYPLVEQFLRTKSETRAVTRKYLLCRLLTVFMLVLACSYLLYYVCKLSQSDQFSCELHTGCPESERVPSGVIMPICLAESAKPVAQTLQVPACLQLRPGAASCFTDLSIYLPFLEENLSKLKSFRCLQLTDG
ncbi:hypothetical protein AMELA_G00256210 [Ameiurus melas]|uniref:Pannexin n=1 Tax=Ameiurus melas TaxID=219545 RepID=A0A7J5ZRD2_AMEME|nr:hypothetical protein AMELA_G00256210 [Ameiurus melas]